MSTYNQISALAVDDNKFVLTVAVRLLQKLGLKEVVGASDGGEALSVIEQRGASFDFVLCDLDMPGIDGIELLRHLAQQKSRAGIVLFSGVEPKVLKTAETLAAAHGLRILGSIRKPVAESDLIGFLDKLDHGDGKAQRRKVGPTVSAEELDVAIRVGQIQPYFQPKIDIANGQAVGVEALARWIHPEKGVIGPDQFIPLAEESGLMDPLTWDMISKSLGWLQRWNDQQLKLRVAVNLSVSSLKLDLPEKLTALIVGKGVSPSDVIIEVTESGLVSDLVEVLDVLTRLRMRGIDLSIDDFGTGYSTMQQLTRIPFNELKIDRGFVAGADQDDSARAVLESSIDLARKLDLKVVAEGVETREDWALLERLGVDLAQGYLMSKPMAGEEILAWVRGWHNHV